MPDDLARRRSLLTAALGFALLDKGGEPAPPAVLTVRRWLDNWTGVGHVVTGMNRQGYRLHVTNMDASTWRASFSRAPLLAEDGFGNGTTPGRAVQAWDALGKTPGDAREPMSAPDVIVL